MGKKEERIDALRGLIRHGPQGSACLDQVKDLMRRLKYKKTIPFLRECMCSEPVIWSEVKDMVWDSLEEQNQNKFEFIQGDLIISSLVRLPGQAEMTQAHKSWVVISPTCDAIREDYIRVAPAFEVRESFKNGSEEEKEYYTNFRYASEMVSIPFFPYIPFKDDDDDDEGGFLGYFVDLTIPGFLMGKDKGSAVAHYSLTREGWNLLNMHIQRKMTRATLGDELAFRQSASKVVDIASLDLNEKANLIMAKNGKNKIIQDSLTALNKSTSPLYKEFQKHFLEVQGLIEPGKLNKLNEEQIEQLDQSLSRILDLDKELVGVYVEARSTIGL